MRIVQINKNAIVGVQTRCHRRTLTSPSRGELWRRTIVAGRTCENLTTKLIRQCDDSMLNKNPKFFGDSPLRSSLWCRSRRFVYCYLSHAQGGSLTPTRSLILNHPHLFASDYSRGFLCYCTHTGTAPEEGKKNNNFDVFFLFASYVHLNIYTSQQLQLQMIIFFFVCLKKFWAR